MCVCVRGAKRREARLQRQPPPAFSRAQISFLLWSWASEKPLYTTHLRGIYIYACLRFASESFDARSQWHSLKALRLFVSLPLAYEITIILAALQRNYKQTHCPLRRALFTLPLDYLCGQRYHRRYLSDSVLTARVVLACWPKLKIQLRLRPTSTADCDCSFWPMALNPLALCVY